MNQIATRQQLEQQAQRIPGASQATGIEQSRAIAEVQAAVAVAQRFPRNEGLAMEKTMEACGQMSMAESAFFSFPRGGQSVNGPSIALAVELARCWGNVDYGIMELARDDEAGHTEMLAFAWDLQTNTKSRQTFIVPHSRDTKSGAKKLTDQRDIYENNANNGARRLRECIFRVLPKYLRSAAESRCRQTLEKGEGEAPLPQRIARSISAFTEIGVSLERLELRQGNSKNWTPVDLANLHILFTSIRRGETTIEEAFPREGAAVDETVTILRQRAQQQEDTRPLGEQLGDSIPALDQQQPQVDHVQGSDPSEGDEPEQEDAAEEESPAAAMLRTLWDRLEAAKTKQDVAGIEADFLRNKAGFDEAEATSLQTAIDKRAKALPNGEG